MAASVEPLSRRARPSVGARIRNLPVGRKLFFGFASVAVLVLALVAVVLGTVSGLGAANDDITKKTLPKVEAAAGVRFGAADVRAAQHAYLIDSGASRSDFESAAHGFEEAVSRLESVAQSPAEHALADKIATGFQTYLAVDQLIWEELQQGRAQTARNLSLGAEALDFGFITEDARLATDLARTQERTATAAFETTASGARTVAIGAGVLAILLVLGLSILVTRSIRSPLARVQRAAERAAAGDLDAEADVGGDDEIGRLAVAFNAMLGKLRERESLALEEHARQLLDGRLNRALEMADTEEGAYDVIGRSLGEIVERHPAELLLADSSKAHLEAVVVTGPDDVGPGCPVGSPFDCTAVRNGRPMTFPTSTALDACPLLRDRPSGSCSATCVPVTFMGRALGVIHTTGPDGEPPQPHQIEELEMLSTKAGARIGVIRSFARTHTQANTDGLTGLLNRRSFETQTRAMHRAGVQFAVLMADLDHFKQLNDTYGHEAGDRALRVFSEVLRNTARNTDLATRFGGEEFVLVVAGADAAGAAEVADRIRVDLAGRIASADVPPFTASFGTADSRCSDRLEEVIRTADAALYEAKKAGRNRVVVSSITPPAPEDSAEYTDEHGPLVGITRTGGFAAMGSNDDPLDP